MRVITCGLGVFLIYPGDLANLGCEKVFLRLLLPAISKLFTIFDVQGRQDLLGVTSRSPSESTCERNARFLTNRLYARI